MHFRPFRLFLVLMLLVCLNLLLSIVALRAVAHSRQVVRSFQPSGHGIVIPQMVDTATIPQVRSAGPSETFIQEPAQSGHSYESKKLPAPQNVVSVPAPTTTDSSAKFGLSQRGGKPDANGAGGLDNYLETVNTRVAIYTRRGALEYETSFQNWFGSTASFIDPVTTWDNTGSRFIFSVLQLSSRTLWLSVAQQTNATGRFCNYTFTFLAGHDFDKLGVNSAGIYFSANLDSPTTGQVVSNELFFVNRTPVENCQAATYTNWTGLTNPDGTIAEAITPARMDTNAVGVEYLVNSYPGGACQLTLWTLTSSAKLSNTSVPTQCYSPPPAAPQKGSSAMIDAGDCSITQAYYINGLLTVDTPGSYDWGDGNGPVGIVEWYVLNPSTAGVANQGAFGTPGYWLFYPDTIRTPNGNLLFVYNASAPTIYPSAWYANQTFTSATALANGTSYYGTSGLSLWGDYQSAWPDAGGVSTNSVWITGEYVASTNTWGTAYGLITP